MVLKIQPLQRLVTASMPTVIKKGDAVWILLKDIKDILDIG
jgi:hypothetical protein